MQELLDEKKAALISERLHDNALLHTCRSVWPQQQEKIESVTASPEDIFCMAAWLTDKLINAEEDIDAMPLVRGLWSAAINDIARWNSNGVVSLADRYIIASTVFRIVATAFSLHWHHHYSDTLRDALLKVIEEKLPKPKDLYEHQQQEEQQEELTMAIVDCADNLNEWVNEYIDNSDYSLTGLIHSALNSQPDTPPSRPAIFLDDDDGLKEKALRKELANAKDDTVKARKILYVARYIKWITDVQHSMAKDVFGDIFGTRNQYSRMLGHGKNHEKITQDDIMNIEDTLMNRLEKLKEEKRRADALKSIK